MQWKANTSLKYEPYTLVLDILKSFVTTQLLQGNQRQIKMYKKPCRR